LVHTKRLAVFSLSSNRTLAYVIGVMKFLGDSDYQDNNFESPAQARLDDEQMGFAKHLCATPSCCAVTKNKNLNACEGNVWFVRFSSDFRIIWVIVWVWLLLVSGVRLDQRDSHIMRGSVFLRSVRGNIW
jgi:hypothetical protein